jgi:hypothetical protein
LSARVLADAQEAGAVQLLAPKEKPRRSGVLDISGTLGSGLMDLLT